MKHTAYLELRAEDGSLVRGEVEVTKWYDLHELYQKLYKALEAEKEFNDRLFEPRGKDANTGSKRGPR